MMQKIILETSDGRPVVTGLIPPFNALPPVVIWGERFFQLHHDRVHVDHTGAVAWFADETPVYREVFVVALAIVEEGQK